MGWKGMIARWLGAPNANSSESFIPETLWPLISDEILNQCDELDGVKDGVITEPDACEFRPEAIQCTRKQVSNCLTKPQVEALRKIFEPLYGKNGDLLFPRYDPGAEAAPDAFGLVFSGSIYRSTEVSRCGFLTYEKLIVCSSIGRSTPSITTLSMISTTTAWKTSTTPTSSILEVSQPIVVISLLSWTGEGNSLPTTDAEMKFVLFSSSLLLTLIIHIFQLIPAGNSKRLYNLVSRTMEMPSLDPFYRLFLVPGLNHCVRGVGAVNIGQHGLASPSLTTPTHNVLTALVDWVESGVAPDTITGISDDGLKERVHCRYPQKSVWNGMEYYCVA